METGETENNKYKMMTRSKNSPMIKYDCNAKREENTRYCDRNGRDIRRCRVWTGLGVRYSSFLDDFFIPAILRKNVPRAPIVTGTPHLSDAATHNKTTRGLVQGLGDHPHLMPSDASTRLLTSKTVSNPFHDPASGA